MGYMFLRWVVLYIVGLIEEKNFFVGDLDQINNKADNMRIRGELKEADEFIHKKQQSLNSRMGCVFVVMIVLLILIFGIFGA